MLKCASGRHGRSVITKIYLVAKQMESEHMSKIEGLHSYQFWEISRHVEKKTRKKGVEFQAASSQSIHMNN